MQEESLNKELRELLAELIELEFKLEHELLNAKANSKKRTISEKTDDAKKSTIQTQIEIKNLKKKIIIEHGYEIYSK